MKKFKEWQIENENYSYSQHIDGPPLEPHTISGAEVQIRQLARNIRTTFNLDERWKQHHQQILKATELLDQAANAIGEAMSGEERNTPHQYYRK
jgi:hypothetical protein